MSQACRPSQHDHLPPDPRNETDVPARPRLEKRSVIHAKRQSHPPPHQPLGFLRDPPLPAHTARRPPLPGLLLTWGQITPAGSFKNTCSGLSFRHDFSLHNHSTSS